jgi:glycosyltransferase involved in cell wall biosynthesis
LPENDSEAWAKAIIEVIGSAELRGDMARRGLQRVQAYSVAAIAEQYRSYYRDLADRRRLAA